MIRTETVKVTTYVCDLCATKFSQEQMEREGETETKDGVEVHFCSAKHANRYIENGWSKRMKEEVYHKKAATILERIPPQYRSGAKQHAYNTGHAHGYEEVLMHLEEIADVIFGA